MLRRILFVCALIFVTTSCLWAQDTSASTSQLCSPRELMTAVLTPTDPVYAETVQLTRELENHGFVVGCVLQSKMVGTFEGQLGAALYRMSRGVFEALFLPKPHTFASLRLIERLKNGRYPLYSYSFEGTPRSPVTEGTPRSPVTFNCARRTFFSRRANRFFVTEDKQLAANLGEILIPD